MVDKHAHDEKRAMADRLRNEARQTRPTFSESLHAKICRAVEGSKIAEPPRRVAPSRLGRIGIAAALAASLVVAVSYLVWQGSTPSGPEFPRRLMPKPDNLASLDGQEDIAVEPDPELGPDEDLQSPTDVPGNPAVDIGLLVDATLADRRWAYLDHDARLAARMLLTQLSPSIVWPEDEL
jgi:hypothetical protein